MLHALSLLLAIGGTGILPVLFAVPLLSITASFTLAAEQIAEPSAADAEFFESEIRPLLIARCHKCHGDMLEPKGGLTLTSRDAILKGGESGPAVVPGKPAESLLIEAVHYAGLEMPPEGDRLKAVQVAALERWIERGLPWPKTDAKSLAKSHFMAEEAQIAAARQSHWAFKPVSNPPLPVVRDADWSQTTIDRFILAALEGQGLAPSPPADKRTLLRRLSFDLVGLPPTPEELAAFVADDSPDAVERAVDRLLASPHHGERWGRHWLDVARYADTKGYVLFKDSNIPWAYTYRDYVVRALNDDLPYDRFIIEQLAADKLPLGDDRRPLTALGFLTLGSGFMNNQQDVIDDRVDVVTRGLLGLTVTCARCHDHKFDPIPTRDYYALYGVFASSIEPIVPPLFEPPPKTEAYEQFAAELTSRQRKLDTFIDEKFRALIDGAHSRVTEYLLAAHELKDRPPTEDFMLLADPNDLNPTMIIRYQTYLARMRRSHDPVWAAWHALADLPAADFSARAPEVIRRVLDEAPADAPIHSWVAAALLADPPTTFADVAARYGKLLVGVQQLWQVELDRATQSGQPMPAALADPAAEMLRLALDGPDAPAALASSEINELMLLPDREAQNIRNKLIKEIEDFRAAGDAAPPRAMVLEDLAEPVHARVFIRGNPTQLGDEVQRRFLRVLCEGDPPPFNPNDSGRLELAQAIADRNNPLTARVIVNRVWLAHFGAPLVATPSDFGLRSTPPTHPELLDHLAWNFMEHGWSLKWLHRQIVLSAAYQQASVDRTDCRAIDPENARLWRMNPRRLDFESTRDALLSVAGQLSPAQGGKPFDNVADPSSTRRTLYARIDRLNLPGVFRTFDFPNPDASSPERNLTTIPQQALFLMNNPLVQTCARQMLARPDVASLVDEHQKVRRLYQLAFGRDPIEDERQWSLEMLKDAAARPAAWEEFAQGLVLANEFVFID
ncbi:MAG: PSD1 and planctomycete cytochrome C domain-containing protein [Pirellulales bacterium]